MKSIFVFQKGEQELFIFLFEKEKRKKNTKGQKNNDSFSLLCNPFIHHCFSNQPENTRPQHQYRRD